MVHAGGSLGIMGVLSESIYKDTDSKSSVIPNISYKGERFYFRLPEIGYQLIPNNKMQSLNVGVSYEGAKFDPDDSSDANIKLLPDRDDAVMAFASYRLGPISAKLAQDISGTHDGFYTQISTGFPIPVGSLKIIPTIAYRYIDAKMSNSLFGVSTSDSAKTSGAIAAYNSSSVSLTTIGVRVMYPLTKNALVMLNFSQSRYDDDILDSPIVEDDTVNSVLAGLIYNF
jgi:outer membrane protein